MDGLLEASGWWGKQFVDSETVHPLLFPTGDRRALWAVNPILAFGGLGVVTKLPALRHRNHAGVINSASPLLRTQQPQGEAAHNALPRR